MLRVGEPARAPGPEGRRPARGSDRDRPVEISAVDLARTVHDVAARLGASQRVVIDIPEGTVAADLDLIVEIVAGLLEHALEVTRDGSKVTICADSDKSGLRLWVSDRGLRIDPTDRVAIPERLRRIIRSATGPHGGPGVGLHLVTPLVREPRVGRSSASAA